MNLNRWRIVALGVMALAAFCLFSSSPLFGQGATSDQAKLETVRKISQRFKVQYPDAEEISPSGAMALSEKGEALFVDVRTAAERAVSVLPGAVSQEAFEKNPGMADGKAAVAYCTIGARSGAYSQKMNRKGQRVLSISGGLLAWLLEGGKVYNAGEETRRVHVFGDGWNFLPEGYEAATGGR